MSSSPTYFIKIGKTISGPFPAEKIPLLWKAGKLPEHTAVSVDKASWENIPAHLGLYAPEPQVSELEEDHLAPGEEAEITYMPPRVPKTPKAVAKALTAKKSDLVCFPGFLVDGCRKTGA